MGTLDPRKEWSDLEFYLWRVKQRHRTEWPERIYIYGSAAALQTLVDSLKGLLELFESHLKGTRRFKSNPPPGFDFEQYGKKVGAKFEWFDWLIVKLTPDAPNNALYKLEGRDVTLVLNPHSLAELISAAINQLSDHLQYPHGRQAPAGLYFAPDWLGME
jgi:hypothetical protein